MEFGKTAFAALFVFAVLSAAVFAADGGRLGGREKGAYVDSRSTYLACRIDFTTGVLDQVSSAVPQAGSALSGASSKLKSDAAQLDTLAAGSDPGAFNSFVSGTLKPDMQSAITALAQARKNYKDYNVSRDTIATLRTGFKSAQDTMKVCENNAAISLGTARITAFNDAVGAWQDSANKLAAKGLSVTAIQGVIDSAKSNVIAPLQAAVNSGNSQTVKDALKTYCLGNGCSGSSASATPYNYHGYAKVNLERLQAIYEKLASTGSGSSSLASAKAKLDSARSSLLQIGTGKYTDGQLASIEQDLKGAMSDLKTNMKENKPAKNATASS